MVPHGEAPGVEVDLATSDLGPGVVLQIGRGSRGEVRSSLSAEEARRIAIVLGEAAEAVDGGSQFRDTTVVEREADYVLVGLNSNMLRHEGLDDEVDAPDYEDGVDLALCGISTPLDPDEARQVASVLVQAAEAVEGES